LINLDGQKALVTGGTRGIGLTISKTLAQCGADVLPIYKSDHWSAQDSGFSNAIAADLTTLRGIATVKRAAKDLDIFVHCAGINIPGPLEDIEYSDIDKVLNTNLRASVALSKALKCRLGTMGSIIYISSVSGVVGPISAPYAAAKSGLFGLTATLARSWAKDVIRVNCVAPGYIESPMAKAGARHPLVQEMIDSIPLKRLGVAQEVANVVVFLASDAASYVTGQVWHVNGGLR